MKILELCTSAGWGGLELYVLNISKWLQQQGHDCLVVTSQDSLISRRLQDSGVKKAYITPRLKFLPIWAAIKLARVIDKQQSDILHVHWTKDLFLAVLAKCISSQKPKLVFIRHMTLTRHKRDAYHRFIYQNIDAFLVITRRLQTEARKFLPLDDSKIHLLYHGVAEQDQADQTTCEQFLRQKDLDRQAFRILLPGRIEHGKGQHILVEAVHILKQGGFELGVAMLGHIMDQSYFDTLQKQIKSWGLEDNFRYLGFVENPVYIYNCFDVLVLTTYAETFGLVLIEGMKCGVPVVGSNAGGVPEVIEHGKTGLLYEPGDAAGLASCIRQLLDNQELCATLAKAGKQFADEVFSEQQHYTKLMQIFTGLTDLH